MTKQEAGKLIYVIKATYPASFMKFTDADYANMIMAWAGLLEDYTYEQASAGLKIYMSGDTKGFPPSPGQVIDCITKLTHKEPDSDIAAWELVYNTMSRMSWDNVQDTFDKLPEAIQRTLGSAGRLREMAMEESAAAQLSDRTRFMDAYKVTCQRMRDDAKIPKRIRLEMKNAGLLEG